MGEPLEQAARRMKERIGKPRPLAPSIIVPIEEDAWELRRLSAAVAKALRELES